MDKNRKKKKNLPEVAGAVRLELTTVGFGDRCSTIRTMPLQNANHYLQKAPTCKVFF